MLQRQRQCFWEVDVLFTAQMFEAAVCTSRCKASTLFMVVASSMVGRWKTAMTACAPGLPRDQAFSLLLSTLSDSELKKSIRGLALLSPWLDLTCGSHTYVSNAFAAEANTGDLAFREHADENRAGFKGMGLTYTGSAKLLKDCLFSPYWLSREESDLLQQLQASQVPTWICTGASETLAGEALLTAEPKFFTPALSCCFYLHVFATDHH
eukprot:Skav231849  [mRNA]  locus=scaffold2215:398655:401722:- [translate_table: standard]